MEIDTLSEKIDELIQLMDALEQKHDKLEADKQDWLTERAGLLEKNLRAKTRVEAMIVRLRSLG